MDLKEFWEKSKPTSTWDVPENDVHRALMEDLVAWVEMAFRGTINMLDVGSGSGRLYRYLTDADATTRLTMIDFINSARAQCEKNTGSRPVKWDGVHIPYADNTFDLVVMMDLLIHIEPKKVQWVMDDAKRVSKKYIYVSAVTWDYLKAKDPRRWCFSHDYDKLFDGLEIVNMKEYPVPNPQNLPNLEVVGYWLNVD